jgi:hypothetical protein
MGTKIITVRVWEEPDHVDFAVHENLLRKSSPFFEAALSNDWLESEQRIVKLPLCREQTFHFYVQWIYTGRLHIKQETSHMEGMMTIARSYVLGEYLQDIHFRDCLMDATVTFVNETTGNCGTFLYAASRASEHTIKSSPLQMFAKDVAVWKMSSKNWDYFAMVESEDWNRFRESFPLDLAFGVIVGLSKRLDPTAKTLSPFTPYMDPCRYHCHGAEPCYITKKNG